MSILANEDRQNNLTTQVSSDTSNYRLGIGAVLCNQDKKVLVARRIKGVIDGPVWQMPQGGVEEQDKDVYVTIERELKEELGLKKNQFHIIQKTDDLLYYDIPAEYRKDLWNGRYIGQKQHWFLCSFQGKDDDIDLSKATDDEFCDYKWVTPAEAIANVLSFKKDLYKTIFTTFSQYFDNVIT
jgi:putative (di)nucleoside polyphosphate hydrolase